MAVIVITGGTAGVGKATALHFAKAGYDVGIIARDEESLHSTQEELRRFGINAYAVHADVADSKAVLDAANEIEYRLGAIDVWVNNAMGAVLAPFRTMTPDEFRRVTEVTYLGYVNGTRAALELLWVGSSTIQSIVGQFLFPAFLDKLMVNKAWEGQMTDTLNDENRQDYLDQPINDLHKIHGTFSAEAKERATVVSSGMPGKVLLGSLAVASLVMARLLSRRK